MLGLSGLRAMALEAGAPSVPVGAAFALAIAAPVLAAPALRSQLAWLTGPRGLLLGVGLGVALLLPGAWLRAVGYHTLGEAQPPGLLAAWVPAVLLVATAEEVALRGALQPMLRAQLGPAPAIALTAVVFSLMHLALYGAAALWLDLGVGLLLGCLREYTGGVAPCALAHAIADLGAWWLP